MAAVRQAHPLPAPVSTSSEVDMDGRPAISPARDREQGVTSASLRLHLADTHCVRIGGTAAPRMMAPGRPGVCIVFRRG